MEGMMRGGSEVRAMIAGMVLARAGQGDRQIAGRPDVLAGLFHDPLVAWGRSLNAMAALRRLAAAA